MRTFLFILVSIFGACHTPDMKAEPPRNTAPGVDTTPHQVQLSDLIVGPDDFKVFYQRFLRDSAYQLAHIDFPLEGYSTDAQPTDSSPEELPDTLFYWEKATWNVWKDLPIDTSEYGLKQQVEKNSVNHYLFLKESGFYLFYTFERRSGQWMLTHYTEHNL